MALVLQFTCNTCHRPRHEVVSRDPTERGVCQECRSKASSRARRMHLAALKGLTTKERIEKIEALLYDLDINRRLSAMEAANARY